MEGQGLGRGPSLISDEATYLQHRGPIYLHHNGQNLEHRGKKRRDKKRRDNKSITPWPKFQTDNIVLTGAGFWQATRSRHADTSLHSPTHHA